MISDAATRVRLVRELRALSGQLLAMRGAIDELTDLALSEPANDDPPDPPPSAPAVEVPAEPAPPVEVVSTPVRSSALSEAAYGTDTHAVPPLPMPAYLESVACPTFGGIITRVSGDQGDAIADLDSRWTNSCRHVYSTTPAWNADGSLLAILNRGARNLAGTSGAPSTVLLDGRTYAPIDNLYPVSPSGWPATEARWHGTDPDALICTGGGQVFQWSVSDKSATLIVDIGGPLFVGAWQGNTSHDSSRVVVVSHADRARPGITTHVVDVDSGKVTATRTFLEPDTDTITMSASGDYVIWNGAREAGQYDRTSVMTPDLEEVRFLPLAGVPSHYDTGYDADGNEVICGTDKPGHNDPVPDYGRLMTHRLSDGEIRSHTDAGEARHTSMRNTADPGHAFVTYGANPGRGHLVNEIARVRLDGLMSVERLCHHRSTESQYWAQAQACPSPDGTRAVFASDWGLAGGAVSCYVVEREAA